MEIEEVVAYVEGLGSVLTLRPQEGDGTPEIAWGDVFFYYEVVKGQPFATIVTKDYPDDAASRLGAGRFRVNVAARGVETPADADPAEADMVFAHPVYARQGWVAVVDPGPRTDERLKELLCDAHAAKRSSYRR